MSGNATETAATHVQSAMEYEATADYASASSEWTAAADLTAPSTTNAAQIATYQTSAALAAAKSRVFNGQGT